MHISSDGIRPNSGKISAIQPSPSSLKELRGALGSLSYFRRFIPNFADTAKPLYRLLEKQVDHRQFVWSSECETAFQQLKQCLCQAPTLAFPNFNEQFTLTTDASLVGIGGILTQHSPEGDRPIALFSRTLNKAEQNYPTHERELLQPLTKIVVTLRTGYFKTLSPIPPCSMLRKTEHSLGRKRKYDEFPTLTRGSRGNPKVSQVYCRRLYNNLFNMISNFREDLIVSLSYDVNIIAKYS